jgi:3'-phosphoadenosine 5'-phosphosulfate sulfotransferase (PAPS reductase)/FAD synthetase
MKKEKLHICLISGGKDSQATAIFLKNHGIKSTHIFCDTGWEDETTYEFLKEFEEKLGSEIITLKGERTFVELAKHKKRFPSTKAKFCTEELKIKPTIDFILNQTQDVVIYQGIRWEESKNRSTFEKSDDFFKHYFEPYGYDKKGKPKFYTYRKKDIINWINEYSCSVERPIISWTTQQVFDYIIDNGFMPNKLYKYGFTRVGCFPCIMCTKDEIAKVVEYNPSKIDYLKNLEIEMGGNFFPPNYIPIRFCSKKVNKIDKETGKNVAVGIPSIMDVVNYVKQKNYGSGLFSGSFCQNEMLPCE